MFRPFTFLGTRLRLRRWTCAIVVIGCLGLSGCCRNLNLRGETFKEDDLTRQARRARTPDKNNELFGVSNKAQQIEKSLGVQ